MPSPNPVRAADDVLIPVVVSLCDRCLDGEGGECHTPGCALWMNRAPDVAIRSKVEPAASASSFKEEGSDRRERAYEAALEEYGTLDALVQQHPDQHVALLRDAVDAALGVMAYTGPLKPPAPSVSQQETGEHLRTRACPTHGNLHVAPTGIEPIDRCPVLCVSGEECGELLGPTRTWHPAPSQQEGGGDA